MQHGIMTCICIAPRLTPESPGSPSNFPNVGSEPVTCSLHHVYTYTSRMHMCIMHAIYNIYMYICMMYL